MFTYSLSWISISQRFRDIFAAEQYRPVFFGERSDVAALYQGF